MAQPLTAAPCVQAWLASVPDGSSGDISVVCKFCTAQDTEPEARAAREERHWNLQRRGTPLAARDMADIANQHMAATCLGSHPALCPYIGPAIDGTGAATLWAPALGGDLHDWLRCALASGSCMSRALHMRYTPQHGCS